MAGTARKPSAVARTKKHAAHGPDLNDPALYVNRELGLLSFQWRVLEEALDDTNPLLERVNFLAIVGSNLNEFFMVRVASLTAQVDAGIPEFGPDRMSPSSQLVAIRREVKRLVDAANASLDKQLKPELAAEGIEIVNYADLSPKQLQASQRYFQEIIFPSQGVLSPRSSTLMMVDKVEAPDDSTVVFNHEHSAAARWTGRSSESNRGLLAAPAYSLNARPSGRCCALACFDSCVV
jgi:hypothetical protein